MRFAKLFFVMIFISVFCSAFAQLAITLKTNQMTYMQYEPIYVHLRIRNDSGRPVVFGKNSKLLAKLYFEITDQKGRMISPANPKPILMEHGKVINPGQLGNIVLKFSNYYNLPRVGTYRIHAYIGHPMFKDQFKSNDVSIEITRGATVWSRTIGVPDGSFGKNGEVISKDSTRTYSIRRIADGSRLYYYCVLEDTAKVYQVFRMAQVVNSDIPDRIIDMSGALHMLVNISPKVFKYYKLDITGKLVDDGKYYKTAKTVPALIKSNDGKIFVSGGAPAIANVDYLIREDAFKAAY